MILADEYSAYYESPIGTLQIVVSDHALRSIHFTREPDSDPNSAHPLIDACRKELEEFFDGRRKEFSIPLDPQGTTFQKKIWAELVKIPYGKTLSYMDIAKKIGDPKSIRAVGLANGKNPIPIVIPCHRVIGSNGSLVGYSGEMWRKKWLLGFEQKELQPSLF